MLSKGLHMKSELDLLHMAIVQCTAKNQSPFSLVLVALLCMI